MKRRKNFDYLLFFKRNCICAMFAIGAIAGLCQYIKPFGATGFAVAETLPFLEETGVKGYWKPVEEIQQKETEMVLAQAEETDVQPTFTQTLESDDIILQPETDIEITNSLPKVEFTEEDMEELKNFNSLKSNFYIIDKRTDLLESDMDPEAYLAKDFSIDTETEGPKVLLFHTHSSEGFLDSDMSKGIGEGIYGVGEYLKELLETRYGIECLHVADRFDVVDGKTQILGAYERMEPVIRQILAENPSIEVIIDMHRDGVNEGTHLVTEVNGKPTAQIMFFNGMTRIYNNGVLEDITSLPNPYVKDNLAFSFHMQLVANKLYPGFTRRIYLNAYRYSLHMLPKSTLIEVGAQTNTKEEAKNAMEPLAEILAEVLLNP